MSPKNEEKEDFLDELKKGTNKVIKAGMQFTKIATQKIDESTKIGIEKAKANPNLNKLKIKTEEANQSRN